MLMGTQIVTSNILFPLAIWYFDDIDIDSYVFDIHKAKLTTEHWNL